MTEYERDKELFRFLIVPLIVGLLVGFASTGCTGSDDPIAQAAQLDGEYAIAICAEPTDKVPDGISAVVHSNKRSAYQSVRLHDTGVEYCAIVRDFVPGNVERFRVEFSAANHGIEQLHVYHMPSGTTLASHSGPQHAVFTSVPISPHGTFEFKVIPTQTDEPAVFIGPVKAGHSLLVPIDGLY